MSGILIGAELRSVVPILVERPDKNVLLSAAPDLVEAYRIALQAFGFQAVVHAAKPAFLAGCSQIVSAAGELVSNSGDGARKVG